MDQAKLVELCVKIRTELESIPQNEYPFNSSMYHSKFPVGCCGDTSFVLGKYLHDNHGVESYYIEGSIYGEKGKERGHAWLECEGFIIDITADQFPEITEKVIVEKETEFHSKFQLEREKISASIKFPKELLPVYRKILAQL